jgi:uncharacterized membrane protein
VLRFCPSCGSPLPTGSSACSSCGATVEPIAGFDAAAVATGLTDNLAGALAYLTFLPAIFFLLLEPFNKNRFVRFHSFQSIFLSIAWFTLSFALTVVPLIGWALLFVLPIAGLILWIFVIVEAYRGEKFKVPVVGDLAEKYASNA